MNNLKFLLLPLITLVVGCMPKVQVEAPDKPVEIQLNVNISHEVRVKLDKEIDDLIKTRPDIF